MSEQCTVNRASSIKLDLFQRTMLQWNEFHPYNAIHVVRVPEPLDLERLKMVLAKTLEALALTEVAFDRATRPRAFTQSTKRNASALEISLLAPGSHDVLHAEIERQVNAPFLCGPRVNPFRFFVQALTDSFYLGLTYFHPIGDAESIVLFLKLCLEAYRSKDTAAASLPLEMYPPPGRLLLRHPLMVARRIVGIPKTTFAMRHCFRPPVRNHSDFNTGFVFFTLFADKLRKMLSAARQWDVTLNDLLLAILMKSISPLAARRAQSRKRKQIGLGCIVNLRKELGFGSRAVFGLFLGSFAVTHAAPDSASLESIARDLRRQTREIKERRIPLGTPVELAFSKLLFSCFSTERKKKLYQKNYPLWGGITNMNLNAIWPPTGAAKGVDYFRAVSTGPATPLVLSATTAGDHLNVGLTFRTTVFSGADIEQLKAAFLKYAGQLA